MCPCQHSKPDSKLRSERRYLHIPLVLTAKLPSNSFFAPTVLSLLSLMVKLFHFHRPTAEGNKAALAHFDRAIELQPGVALSSAWLGDTAREVRTARCKHVAGLRCCLTLGEQSNARSDL